MTNPEFSTKFDVFYNNITSNQAPGLDEYEKSVFLTEAQDEILKAYFNPKGNKFQEGFDDSSKRQIDFSLIVKTIVYTPSDVNYHVDLGNQVLLQALYDLHSNSASAEFPTDVLFMINELLLVTRNSKSVILLVVPMNYAEYTRVMSKPYTRPLKNVAWRLSNSSGEANMADLIVGPSDLITKYIIRYVRRPKPIILTTLEDVTIDGQYLPLECELDPEIHKDILKRAVELAKASYIGLTVEGGPASNLPTMVSIGSSSGTNLGIVQNSNN